MKSFIVSVLLFICLSSFVEAQINPAVIINIAKDIWNLIEENKPVVNIETDFADGLPMGVNSSMQLENWVVPPTSVKGSKDFHAIGHASAVKFEWTLEFTHGGDYKGVGKYLDDITISPTKVDVIDFFNFDVVTHIAKPINVGNSSHPIAGVQVDMEYKVTGPVHSDEGAITYFVQGNGEWKCVSECD